MSTILQYGDRGPRVRRLQALLTNNRFRNFRPGPIDGQFGARTGAACSDAKFWLGYARDDIRPVAGDPLFDYLAGTRPLSPAMRLRRAARIAAEKKREAVEPIRLKALARARGEIGTRENPMGSNNVKYNDWFGWGRVAWCEIFQSWCYAPFSSAFHAGSHYAGTDAILADAKAGRNNLRVTSDPKPGDTGVIDFSGHSDPDHALMVESVGSGIVHTIEGNTGDGVFRRQREIRNCWFIRVEK